MNYQSIIDHYFPEEANPQLRHILLVHSAAVKDEALRVCDRHPELNADRNIVEAGAMLHDIGIVKCDAAGIQCFGNEPYIKHGVLGAQMLDDIKSDTTVNPYPHETIEKLKRICARHTGTGLPGLEPETIEEIIVCYADKFFSKTKLDKKKTPEQAVNSLRKFGEEGVNIFNNWHEKLKVEN